MANSSRQRFLQYVRDPVSRRPVVSPFLPNPDVVAASLRHLGLDVPGDAVKNEIALSEALAYEPMFMVGCTQFMFPWQEDEGRSDGEDIARVLPTRRGTWESRFPRAQGLGATQASFPVQTEEDHRFLQAACEETGERVEDVRTFFRDWRSRVGEGGVIVIGHPNPYWLAHQIGQADVYLHYADFPATYRRSMDAVYRASLIIFEIGLQEGFDFMSASGLGLEMNSPQLFEEMDLPYLQAYAAWTHERDGLFWYHNCGRTRSLIETGAFDRIDADVIETMAAAPAGDNILAESRQRLDPRVCTKGNLDLDLLRDRTPERVAEATRRMVADTRGFAHVHSTADAVLPGTPPENFITHLQTARDAAEEL